MLSELLVAGLVTTIIGSFKDRADIRRGKITANEYFRRSNAEREAIERLHNERMEKILARYAKEDQERAAKQEAKQCMK